MSIDVLLEGRYLLERRIGQGGMGIVFKARHTFLKSFHAIKVILPDLIGNDPMLVTRFRQEAMVAAAIRHKNIVTVTDFGVVNGKVPFLVMHFIKGKSLQEILSVERRLALGRALEIFSAVAAGVGAAHRQGIVHRDLKPLNIMVEDDVPASEGVKVLDFGVAKIKSAELFGSFIRAQTFGVMGSPLYMAPEQWSDEEPEKTADIYSLGIILYQMLTGEVPFRGTSIPAIMHKHLVAEPPPFANFGLKAPPRIEELVRYALEKEPAKRPQSVEAFIGQLRDAITEVSHAGDRLLSLPLPDFKPETRSQPQATEGQHSGTIITPDEHIYNDQGLESLAETRLQAEEEVKQLPSEAEVGQRLQGARQPIEGNDEITITKEEALKPRADEAARRRAKEGGSQRARVVEKKPSHVKVTRKLAERETTKPVGKGFKPDLSEGGAKWPGREVDGSQPLPRESSQDTAGHAAPLKSTFLRKSYLIPGIALLVLVIAGFGLSRLLQKPGQTSNQSQPSSKAEMVFIPGGTFMMGRSDVSASDNQWPAHPVTVSSFALDKYEVTNAEYADFVRDTKHEPPEGWGGDRPPAGQEQWPVVNVSLQDAQAFASWRSKRDGMNYRLPTEQEWEYAARGGDNNYLYPWGNGWVDDAANINTSSLKPVGSYPRGASIWGTLDMVGNAFEWTSTEASFYPGNGQSIPEEERGWFVVRGSSYLDKGEGYTETTRRQWLAATRKNPRIGFRLARDNTQK